MTTLITLDPNMPIPDSLTMEDAAHPANIVRSSREIQNQAVEDARYDLKVPDRFRPRKEGFESPFHINIFLLIGICAFMFFFAIAIKGKLGHMYTLIITLAFGVMLVIASR